MATATFIRPDTHLIFLASEVAFTESLGEQEYATLFNWLAQRAIWHTLINVSTLYGTYVSGIHPLAVPIRCSTLLMIWKTSYEIQNEKGMMNNLILKQYSQTNAYQKRQNPHPTHASLISQFLVLRLMPNSNVFRALHVMHMPSTWLYNDLNRGYSHLDTVHKLKRP